MIYHIGRPLNKSEDQNEPVEYEFYNFEFVSNNVGTRALWDRDMRKAYPFTSKEKAENVIGGNETMGGCKVVEGQS